MLRKFLEGNRAPTAGRIPGQNHCDPRNSYVNALILSEDLQ